MSKTRLDVLLTDRGLAPSRERAKALIMAGTVYIGGVKAEKAGDMVPEDAFFMRGGIDDVLKEAK